MAKRHLAPALAWALFLSLWLPGVAVLAQDTPPPGLAGTGGYTEAEHEQLHEQLNAGAALDDFAATPSYVTFLHVANAGNTVAHVTTIDHPATNNNPSALLFVTHNWNPGGIEDGVYNDGAVGVWYDDGKWKIFNQDRAHMPANTAFNVLVLPAGSNAFIHQASAANTVGNSTVIQNPLTNGRPNALLFITPNWSAGSIYNAPPTNVWYDSGAGGRWVIGNQNGAAMPLGVAFNVLVLEASANAFVHRATAANTAGHITDINNPLTNNKPNRLVFITQNFNPGGGGGVYNARHVGVYYFGGFMRIFNENLGNMPANAAFNVFVPTPNAGAFVHKAAAANTIGHTTSIENPLTNDNPYATVFVTPNWNPNGMGGTYNNHPIGVYYSDGRWRLFNQDLGAMPINAAFNVLVPSPGANVFVHKATSGNISANFTIINHPVTNDNPNARLLVTPNWNPDGGGGVYNNHPIGVFYGDGRWRIFNQDIAGMPVGAAFNVMVLPQGSDSFVHTANAANTNAQVTSLASRRTNNNRHALVFITPNWNPGGVIGAYNNHATGVFFDTFSGRWAVFNQDLANMPVNASFNVYVVGSKMYLPLVNR